MRRRRMARVPRAAALVCGLALVGIGLPAAHGGYTAQVSDTAGSYGAGAVVLSATANSSTCASSPSAVSTDANTNCSSTMFATALNNGSGSVTTTVSDPGTLSAKSATLTGGSTCGVLDSADASSAGDNAAVLMGGVSAAATGPLSGTSSLAFNGSSGYLVTQQTFDAPQTYSIAAWFKTSSSGSILGLTNIQENLASTEGDRMLWLNSSGQLVFGVYDGADYELTSATAYNNNAWHFVVATASSSGIYLYVDGSQVAANSSVTASQNYGGWMHIGWAYTSGWSGGPSSAYFNGDIADVAFFPTALSSSSVSTLYSAASQSAEQSDLLADSPTSLWPLTSISVLATGNAMDATATIPDLSGHNYSATVENNGSATSTAQYPAAGGAEFGGTSTTGYITSNNSFSNPETFSIVAWFSTPSTGGGGTIVGFSNAQTAGGSDADRDLWVDGAGHVVFGVDSGGTTKNEIASASSYADGNWHLAVATLSSSGMDLYVDGSLVAANASVTSAWNYTGYWQMAWGGESAWSDPPPTAYFNGEFNNVAIFPTALTLAQVQTLDGEATQATEQAQIVSDGPTTYWSITAVTPATYCQGVDATVEDDSVSGSPQCLLPAQSGSCPALSASYLLSSLAGASLPLTNIAAAGSDKLKLSVSDTTSTDFYYLMHFSLPLTLSAGNGGFTASLAYPAATPTQTFQG